MYVCMYECMYVCIYVCMYVHNYVNVFSSIGRWLSIMVAMVMRIASLMTTLTPSPPLQLVSGYFNLLSLPTIYWCPYFFIKVYLEVLMCSLLHEVVLFIKVFYNNA